MKICSEVYSPHRTNPIGVICPFTLPLAQTVGTGVVATLPTSFNVTPHRTQYTALCEHFTKLHYIYIPFTFGHLADALCKVHTPGQTWSSVSCTT